MCTLQHGLEDPKANVDNKLAFNRIFLYVDTCLL